MKSHRFFGGGRWIRTIEAEKQQIYSLPPLAAREPPHIGAGGRIRTPDLLITNQLLYQLSYTSIIIKALLSGTRTPVLVSPRQIPARRPAGRSSDCECPLDIRFLLTQRATTVYVCH